MTATNTTGRITNSATVNRTLRRTLNKYAGPLAEKIVAKALSGDATAMLAASNLLVAVIHYDILKGSGARHDITKWLGESCVINTSKGIFEPFGTFTITFLDRPWPKPGGYSSLYSKVGPMDAIVIKAAHNGADMPRTIMRGFVTSVRRSEVMGDDGRPARRVTITGQDIGKLWTTLGLYFLPYPTSTRHRPSDSQANFLGRRHVVAPEPKDGMASDAQGYILGGVGPDSVRPSVAHVVELDHRDHHEVVGQAEDEVDALLGDPVEPLPPMAPLFDADQGRQRHLGQHDALRHRRDQAPVHLLLRPRQGLLSEVRRSRHAAGCRTALLKTRAAAEAARAAHPSHYLKAPVRVRVTVEVDK